MIIKTPTKEELDKEEVERDLGFKKLDSLIEERRKKKENPDENDNSNIEISELLKGIVSNELNTIKKTITKISD